MTINLHQDLKRYFSFDDFRPGQEEAVRAAIHHKNVLVMLATGTGKSLCYQLSGYIRQQLTVIVSPLISLMMDQVVEMKSQGEQAVAALTSAQASQEKAYILNHLDQYRFIYLSPEMLVQRHVLQALKKADLGLFVVDEAHCISQWGIDFRPEYLMLKSIRKELAYPTTMALTATATQQVRQDIIQHLFSKEEEFEEVVQSVDRPNITYAVDILRPEDGEDKDHQLLDYVRHLRSPGIIYFSSKNKADEVASWLTNQTHLRVAAYHADLTAEDRYKIQMQFLDDQLDVICATNAFGMGVNKKNIRYIIHYHMSSSPEMYMQESGRAGRDGEPSLALLLFQAGDERIQEYFLTEEHLDEASIRAMYNGQLSYSDRAQFKTIDYLRRSGKDIDSVVRFIQRGQENKKSQVKAQLNYIYNPNCRRQFLLSYFGENKKEVDGCCDYCEHNCRDRFIQSQEIQAIESKAPTSLTWRDKIDRLFNI